MSNNYENKYSLSAIIQLLNPDNTISAHRMLAHAIGITETMIYSALISKQTYYLQNDMLHEGGWFFSTIADLQESTTFGAKAQKTAVGNLIKRGLIECECKGMPAKRFFRITNDMEILMKLIDEGTEICKKISAKVNRNSYDKSEIIEDVESVEDVERLVQTAKNIQYPPKAVTDEGAQSSYPSAAACTRPAENHTIKPKINNLNINQSIDQTDRLIPTPLKFSEIMESLGLEWYTFTANEPTSEKYFLYHDENDRKTQKCKIPYTLKNDKRNMKSALRYLCCYSYYFGEGNEYLPDISKEIQKLIDTVYENCYIGMVEAVNKAYDLSALNVRPEVMKSALANNVEKLTLPALLEKNRKEIVYEIKQTVSIGLMNGDRYDTMSRKLVEKLDFSYGKANNVVRTETHRNIEAGLMDGAVETQKALSGSGLIHTATWRTMEDERVRPQHRYHTKTGWKTKRSGKADHTKMEGVTIMVGDKFKLEPNVYAPCPGMSGTARNDCRCRCFLEYDLMTLEEWEALPNKQENFLSVKDNGHIITLT